MFSMCRGECSSTGVDDANMLQSVWLGCDSMHRGQALQWRIQGCKGTPLSVQLSNRNVCTVIISSL